MSDQLKFRTEAIMLLLENGFDTQRGVEENPYGATKAIEDAFLVICDQADRIEQLVRQRDGWEETALMYAQNVDFWKSKLAKAVAALNMVDLSIMENTNETEWRLWGESAVSGIRTTLAELEGK